MHIKKNNKTYIIAEIGVNHNGRISLAKRLIDVAKKSGADAVKFQTFNADKLAIKKSPKVNYQKINFSKKGYQHDMLKKLQLNLADHQRLIKHCKKRKIDFLSTPYDLDSAKYLSKLNIKYFKTSSADLTHRQLHEFLAKNNKSVIISTGASNLNLIKQTLNIYSKYKNKKIILLHCVSNYPCSKKSINLKAINLLKKKFSFTIGYSDHSDDSLSAILSVALGAKVIEKHITLNKKLIGPDHAASSDPADFKDYVNKIREAETILGSEKKEIQKEEISMIKFSRKSLYFLSNFKKGHVIKSNDLECLRPGTGISPMEIKRFLGKKINKNVKKHQRLKHNHFNG